MRTPTIIRERVKEGRRSYYLPPEIMSCGRRCYFRRWQMSWRLESSWVALQRPSLTRKPARYPLIFTSYTRERKRRRRGAFEVLTFIPIVVGGNRLDTTHETWPFSPYSTLPLWQQRRQQLSGYVHTTDRRHDVCSKNSRLVFVSVFTTRLDSTQSTSSRHEENIELLFFLKELSSTRQVCLRINRREGCLKQSKEKRDNNEKNVYFLPFRCPSVRLVPLLIQCYSGNVWVVSWLPRAIPSARKGLPLNHPLFNQHPPESMISHTFCTMTK